jgi:uncharacterized membrane protein YdbT with pleckstrin-like domain
MGFPQRLLADDEQLVLVLRRHVKAVFWPVIVLVLCVAAFGVALWLNGWGIPAWIVGVVAALIALRGFLWPFLVWWNQTYAITTRRLILRTGVLNRSGHDMPLTRLNDVSFEHTLFERMLGCGTLVVESAGERGQLKLDDIPKVEVVQRTLYRLSDDLRGVRGADRIDADVARDLDDAFDEEYRGPSTSGGTRELPVDRRDRDPGQR